MEFLSTESLTDILSAEQSLLNNSTIHRPSLPHSLVFILVKIEIWCYLECFAIFICSIILKHAMHSIMNKHTHTRNESHLLHELN